MILIVTIIIVVIVLLYVIYQNSKIKVCPDTKEDFGGALVQLMAKGPEDLYMTGDYIPFRDDYISLPHREALWNNPVKIYNRFSYPYNYPDRFVSNSPFPDTYSSFSPHSDNYYLYGNRPFIDDLMFPYSIS